MLEFARDAAGFMPRIFAVNHHPEIVDRFRQIMILEQKLDRGEVSHEWYQERLEILTRTYPDENSDQRLHVTSDYTLLGPLRFHLFRAVRRRAESLGLKRRRPRETGCSPTWSARRWPPAPPPKGSDREDEGSPRVVIPKPPFAKDLTLEQEIAEFERLKPRLKEVWNVLTMREEEPHTSVVVPSLTLDQSELKKLPGASFYEERLLFLLIRLAQPAGAHGLRHLAGRAPDHPGVLPPVPGRHPREPRPLAAHPALRRRRLAALPDREDPRAAAAHRAHPGRHRGPARAPTSPSSTPRPSSASSRCSWASP